MLYYGDYLLTAIKTITSQIITIYTILSESTEIIY